MIATLTLNPALDKSTHISGLVPEKKLRCLSPEYFPGGGGINVSRALSRLGLDNQAIYVAGGPAGEMIGKLLTKEKISSLAIEVDEWTRENLVVKDDASGNQYRFTFPGLPMKENDQINVLSFISSLNPFPSILVMSGSFAPQFPLEFITRIQKLCANNHAKLVIDTSGPYLNEAAKSGVHLLKPNYHELCELAGIEGDEVFDLHKIGKRVLEKYPVEILVVSLGANGASIITKDEYHHEPAPKVPVKSTVGAGDSMVAGLVFALSKGKPLKDVLRYGVACGTATTMNDGTGLFKAEQVDRVLELMK